MEIEANFSNAEMLTTGVRRAGEYSLQPAYLLA